MNTMNWQKITTWELRNKDVVHCPNHILYVDSNDRIVGGRTNRQNGLTEFDCSEVEYDDLEILDRDLYTQVQGEEWWV